MKEKGKRVIPYGWASYQQIVRENGYYVDKTEYIRSMEEYRFPVFLRPRRFGKSLWCETLEAYYDINNTEHFDDLFGHTAIGKNPTSNRNKYMTFSLDFSGVEIGSFQKMEKSFHVRANRSLKLFLHRYKKYFSDSFQIDSDASASDNLDEILKVILANELPSLYIIIDEYDNFANQLITSRQNQLYWELTKEGSFLKSFFKVLKENAKKTAVARIFITGVLPLAIDDLASSFNIAEFITLEEDFECMLGFTKKEVDLLLDQVYEDYQIDPSTRKEVEEVIRNNYNGYHFVSSEGEALYNSTILMYFLKKFAKKQKIPEFLIDLNLKTDISWVECLTGSNPSNTQEWVDQLVIENRTPFDRSLLSEKFNLAQFFEKGFFPISFFYLGMVTKLDDDYLCLPNLNMKAIFTEYFNELRKIDVSTLYADLMQGFVRQRDIPTLFRGYWELYISQFPEAVFQQVNENFYRATFYELCRRHLSLHFTWTMERSYSGGRSDLEFIGKFHTSFAGVRYLIEFKYISNQKAQQDSIDIDKFKAKKTDLKQIRQYDSQLRQEQPQVELKSFLIYCFGNRGTRIFELPPV